MIQYTIPFMADDAVNWRVNIYSNLFTGDVTTLTGVGRDCALLSYDGDTDSHFGVFVNSTLTLQVYNKNGEIDVNQLQNLETRQYRIEIQRENVLYWVGYLVPSDISRALKSKPYIVTLTAKDGLDMLESLDYTHNNLPGTTDVPNRCPMNYFRQILFAESNLNVKLPIRWTNNLRNTAYEGQDVFIGGVRWSPRGDGFYSYQAQTGVGSVKKCDYILEGMLKSNQCRIYLAKGRWTIRRVNDYFSGVFAYRQIAGSLSKMIPQSGTENIAKKIGTMGYPFMDEDGIITMVGGIKTSKAEYNADARENIMPNGDQDQQSFAQPLYWSFFDPEGAFIESKPSLDGRSGFSSELTNTSDEIKYFTTYSEGSLLRTGGLPIDAKTLVKKINFGFLFSPQNGFPVIGTIDGALKTYNITNPVSLYADGTYNNIEIVNITGSGSGGVVDIVVSGSVVTSMAIRSQGQGYADGDVFGIPPYSIFPAPFRATVTETEDLPGLIDFSENPLQLQIVLNIGNEQLFLDDFGIWRDTITTLISPSVEGLKIDDVARVNFDKFQGVILPEPTFQPGAGDTCDLKIIFLVKPGQRYTIDNISIGIEDSNDVYVSEATGSRNTSEETTPLNISSSFGGYMVSNFMSAWDLSDQECEFSDGDHYTGTLTGLTADAILRCKYTASKVFNGTISTRGENWSFDEIYTIQGFADARFMPLNAKYNIEQCKVNLVAIETRNDEIARTQKFYGSNDSQLSN